MLQSRKDADRRAVIAEHDSGVELELIGRLDAVEQEELVAAAANAREDSFIDGGWDVSELPPSVVWGVETGSGNTVGMKIGHKILSFIESCTAFPVNPSRAVHGIITPGIVMVTGVTPREPTQ